MGRDYATRDFYRHSNLFSVWSLPAVVGLTFLLFLPAFIYEILVDQIPYIRFRFILVVLFGGGLAFFTLRVIKWTKVRHAGMSMVIGFWIGLAATYFSWIAWFVLNSDYQYRFVWDPVSLFQIMMHRAQNGAWYVDNRPEVGVIPWVAWIGELAILVLIPALYARKVMTTWFFCEKCNRWADDPRIFGPFEISDQNDQAIDQLAIGHKSALDSLQLVSGLTDYQIEAAVYACSSCDEFYPLNMEFVPVIRDATTPKHDLVHGLMLQKIEVDALWDKTHAHLPGSVNRG